MGMLFVFNTSGDESLKGSKGYVAHTPASFQDLFNMLMHLKYTVNKFELCRKSLCTLYVGKHQASSFRNELYLTLLENEFHTQFALYCHLRPIGAFIAHRSPILSDNKCYVSIHVGVRHVGFRRGSIRII
ncbi:hypothetical protein Y032_0820g2527 [Ancylostoma ceylanicum]|uniref:Uncharacterized protein n=1 Tax=Ancylostoma ceylanicum TaxID=53326 RepID=A0A016WCY8_9BILA|nr:hypothetical protein Y032_0820g2527 [Ancylostoma ceylanicum]